MIKVRTFFYFFGLYVEGFPSGWAFTRLNCLGRIHLSLKNSFSKRRRVETGVWFEVLLGVVWAFSYVVGIVKNPLHGKKFLSRNLTRRKSHDNKSTSDLY